MWFSCKAKSRWLQIRKYSLSITEFRYWNYQPPNLTDSLNNWSSIALGLISDQHAVTISVEYGLIRDGSPQLIGCVADIFSLVLLQGVHSITECVEYKWASVLRNLQLWVTAWDKLRSILCPSETWGKKKKISVQSNIKVKKIVSMPLKQFLTCTRCLYMLQMNRCKIYMRCPSGTHKLVLCNYDIHLFLGNWSKFPLQSS